MRIQLLIPVILLLITSAAPQAAPDTVEFSADLIQSIPQQGDMNGRIYVGNDQLRTEFNIGDQTMVQIVDMKNQTTYMLDSRSRSYMKHQAGAGDLMTGGGQSQDANPCAGMEHIKCELLGVESVNGRPARKWEFENTIQEQSNRMLVWIDEERKIPVRQLTPDGASMILRQVGRETVNGRDTEKWEMTITDSEGKSSKGYQWYDPVLKMNVREEQPGGYLRELRNIQTGVQPPSLFTVPPDYSEVSPQPYGVEDR